MGEYFFKHTNSKGVSTYSTIDLSSYVSDGYSGSNTRAVYKGTDLNSGINVDSGYRYYDDRAQDPNVTIYATPKWNLSDIVFAIWRSSSGVDNIRIEQARLTGTYSSNSTYSINIYQYSGGSGESGGLTNIYSASGSLSNGYFNLSNSPKLSYGSYSGNRYKIQLTITDSNTGSETLTIHLLYFTQGSWSGSNLYFNIYLYNIDFGLYNYASCSKYLAAQAFKYNFSNNSISSY